MAFTREALRAGAKTFGIESRRRDRFQRSRHGTRREIVEENSRFTRGDRFERAAARHRNYGTAAGLRFDRHNPKVFLAGEQDGQRPPILVADLLVAQSADKIDMPVGELFETVTVGTVTRDPEPGAGATARLDRDIDSLEIGRAHV